MVYSAVQWSCAETARDISLSFPHIAIHAISRDTTVFPFKPCIFLLYSLPDVDDPEQEEVTHYRLAPPQSNQCTSCQSFILATVKLHHHAVEEIFEAISECQQLYPDSDLSSDSDLPHEGDGGGDLLQEEGYFTTAEGLQHLSAEGESVLAHLEDILHIQEQSGQNGEPCYPLPLSVG